MEDSKIQYHEVDFLLPVHRFNIGFSYLSKRGLPFIREFILRLVHLGPVNQMNLADFLGLSEREIDEAINDLLIKSEIEYCDDGCVTLSKGARGYFSDYGESPQVATVQQTVSTFAFELVGLNCIGSKRTDDDWKCGVSVDVNSERVGLSDQYANSSFQNQFYSLLEKGYMSHIVDSDKKTFPSIYKVDSVTRIGVEPKRVPQVFNIDFHGGILERDGLEEFDNDEEIIESVSASLNSMMSADNTKAVLEVMDSLDDKVCSRYIQSDLLDIQAFISDVISSVGSRDNTQVFLGPSYLSANSHRVRGALSEIFDSMSVEHVNDIPDLLWVAPSDSCWAMSNRFKDFKCDIFERKMTKGKKAKRLFNPKLYLPLLGNEDRSGYKRWKNILPDLSDCHGYIDGSFGGVAEFIVLPRRFALVSYHVVKPDYSSVSVPIGFFTTDAALVSNVENYVLGRLSGAHDLDNDVDLRAFSDLAGSIFNTKSHA